MVVQESKQDAKFLTKEKNGKVVELIMVLGGEKANSLIWISGIIDMKTIGKLAKNLGIEGVEDINTKK